MPKHGRSFEQKTVDFLRLMRFENVDGARDTLKIGNHSPDALGAKEGVLFVIECKDGQRLGNGPQCLLNKLLTFRGRFDQYRSSLKKHPVYGKYKTVWFVMLTRNIIVSQVDIDRCRDEKPRVELWTDDTISYYTDLFDKIDKDCPVEKKTKKKCPQCVAEQYWSIYDFLGEIRLYKTSVGIPVKDITVPANCTSFGSGITMYQFIMNPKDLATIAYVARRDTRDKSFYQRQILKSRIISIGDYINDKKNILPNNIIMAFDESVLNRVQYPKQPDGKPRSQGYLKFPRDYKCCWIIDGQHRFYGFRHATRDMKVPMAVFSGLDPVRQSRIFLDINKFQKEVPPEIVWDLNGDLLFPPVGSPASTPDHYQAIVSRTWKEINKKKAGNIAGTIGIPSQVDPKGLQDFAKLCEALEDLQLATPSTSSQVANPYWDKKDAEKTVTKLFKGIDEFYKSMERNFPDDFARGKAGFVLGGGSGIVMLHLFERIIQYSVTYHRTLDGNLFDHCLKPLKNEIDDFETFEVANEPKEENKLWNAKRECGSRDGKHVQLVKFVRTIRHGIKDDSFAAGLPDLKDSRDYKLAEEEAHDLLEEKYKPMHGDGWLKTVAKGSYDAIHYTATKKHKCKDPNIYHKYATVGQSSEIILGNIGDFSDVFLNGKVSFSNKEELQVALTKLTRYKADGSHIQPGKHSNLDAQIADSYLVKFKDCIALYRKEKAKKNAQQVLSQPQHALTKEAVLQAKESAEGAEIVTDPESSDTLPEQTSEGTDQ